MNTLGCKLAAVVVLAVGSSAGAQISGDPCVFGSLTSVVDPKPARASQTVGSLTYIAEYDGSLAIYNTASPANPVLLGAASIDDPDWFNRFVSDIKVDGGYAFAAVEGSGLAVFDVSDSAHLVLVHSVPRESGRFYLPKIEIYESIAYLTDRSGDVAVFDISTPTNPIELPGLSTGFYSTMASLDVIGDRLYLTEGDVEVYDLANPSEPQFAGSYQPASHALDVVPTAHAGLAVVSLDLVSFVVLTNPAAPAHMGNFQVPGGARSAAVVGHDFYISGYDHRIHRVDISQPTNAVFTGSVDVPTEYASLEYRDGTIFAAGMNGGTIAVDPNRLTPEPEIVSLQTPGTSVSIELADDHAFMVGQGQHGLQAINISDPYAPELVGNFDWWRGHSGLAISGDYACTFDETYGLRLLDISNPQTPVRLSSFAGRLAGDVKASGDRFYFSDDDYELRIFDAGGPGVPVVPTESYPGSVELFAVDADTVYAARSVSDSEISITDYSNLQSPVQLGEVDVYYPGLNESLIDMAAYNSVMITASSDGVLSFIDLSNPAAQDPDFYWSYIGTSLEHISIHGDILALSGGDMPIQLYRLDDPMHPTWLGSVESPGQAGGVAVADNNVYVADGDHGLTIIRIGGDCVSDCPADTNNDGAVTPADFKAWLSAFENGLPECDQNDDGLCSPTDFAAWVANYNAGC